MPPGSLVVQRPARTGFRGFIDRLFSRTTIPDAPHPQVIGGAGDRIAGGFLEDVDANTELRGPKWYGSPGVIGIAQKMMRDPHVRMSLSTRISPVMAARWDFKPASRKAIDIEVADFCRHVFFERIRWRKFLREAQLGYHRDGFAVFEVTSDNKPISAERFPLHPGSGRGFVYTRIQHRPAPTITRWGQSFDEPTELEAVIQTIRGSDGEDPGQRVIPADAILRFTHEQEGANFAGLSTLRSAYGAWKVKTMLLLLDAMRHERQGVGFPSIKLPEKGVTPDDTSTAETILQEMRSHEKGYLILPHGYEFKWESVDTQDTAIQAAIERCNRDIAFNTASSFMLLGQTGGGGSYALSETQAGQLAILVDQDARYIADTVNFGSDGWSPVERIVRMNYGPDVALPEIVSRNLPTKNWTQILPVIKDLVAANIVTADDQLEQIVRDIFDLPEYDPATARVNATPGAFSHVSPSATSAPQPTPLPIPPPPPPSPPPKAGALSPEVMAEVRQWVVAVNRGEIDKPAAIVAVADGLGRDARLVADWFGGLDAAA